MYASPCRRAALLPRARSNKQQWNGFVELLPLWLAPNLVTLLGFFFILGNIVVLEVYVPDLVGPVCRSRDMPASRSRRLTCDTGAVMGILQFCHRALDVLNHG
jgi:hypothetical protein